MELNALIPGFELVINDCDFNDEQIEICKKIGIDPYHEYPTRARRNLRGFLNSWFDHPLPLIFIDKILVDESLFFKNFSSERIFLSDKGVCGGGDSDVAQIDTSIREGKILKLYQNETRFFKTFNLNESIKKEKKLFNEYLFSLIEYEINYHGIQKTSANLNRKYGEMICPSWLYECYVLSTTFFSQNVLSEEKNPLPIMDDEMHKLLYISALKSSFRNEQFILYKNEEITYQQELLEVIDIIAERLHPIPLLRNKSPEDVVNIIVTLKDQIDDPKKQFINIFEKLKNTKLDKMNMSNEILKELKTKKQKSRTLDYKIMLDIGCAAIPIYDLLDKMSIDIHILPFFKCIHDLKCDIEEKKGINWIGFFDKYSKL